MPEADWITTEAPELRIVPESLWTAATLASAAPGGPTCAALMASSAASPSSA